MLVTVATPAYNRAYLLPRLYNSLCSQSCTDFEWLVVDDGSTDGTECTMLDFASEGRISIRYIKKPNGGKHTAVNLAAKEAKGELLFIADSDDWLTDTAIADVIEAYLPIRDDESFAGVCGVDAFPDGRVVGSGLPQQTIDATPQDIRGKWGVSGDLKEVFRTDVLRRYPFPEIEGERFCPEALVWNHIGRKYRLRYIDKVIYIAEYQPDGITSGITRARMKSPVASMMTYAEWFDMAESTKAKLRMAINFWRFAFCAPRRSSVKISGWGKLLMPVGATYHLKDIMDLYIRKADRLAFFGQNKASE